MKISNDITTCVEQKCGDIQDDLSTFPSHSLLVARLQIRVRARAIPAIPAYCASGGACDRPAARTLLLPGAVADGPAHARSTHSDPYPLHPLRTDMARSRNPHSRQRHLRHERRHLDPDAQPPRGRAGFRRAVVLVEHQARPRRHVLHCGRAQGSPDCVCGGAGRGGRCCGVGALEGSSSGEERNADVYHDVKMMRGNWIEG